MRALEFKSQKTQNDTHFWALDDVSFSVEQGESFGLIGGNGAGKSTLLKILSRITFPTKGSAVLRGRVASLLEVGTGFHPELTGRENLYFNGSILGLKKREIDRKFDEIIDFSGVERYIDMPMKHFSSGMQLRLAFAVAAHLEPEVLIIDEVLAVGDAEFQKKCLGKMDEVSRSGRTLLFVSHNMSAVVSLCSRCLVLEKGRVIFEGLPSSSVQFYLQKNQHKSKELVFEPTEKNAIQPQFRRIELKSHLIESGENLKLNFEIESPRAVRVGVEIEIHDQADLAISYASTAPMQGELIDLKVGVTHFELDIQNLALANGSYTLHFWLIQPWVETFHRTQKPLEFEVILSDPFQSGFDFRQSYRRGAYFHTLKVKALD
jgi:lipopolysaccharide transport system ATP-binding protein